MLGFSPLASETLAASRGFTTTRLVSISGSSTVTVAESRFVERAVDVSSFSTVSLTSVIVSMTGRNLQTVALVGEENRSINVHTRRNAP
jgi:uncharacterized membrane protein (DUF4010 family)